MITFCPLLELEGASAYWVHAIVITSGLDDLFVDDVSPAVDERREEGVIYLLEVNDDCVVVDDFHVVQVLRIGVNVASCRGVCAFEGELHVSGGHFVAVVELHAFAEVHFVGGVREELPFFGEARPEGTVRIEEY